MRSIMPRRLTTLLTTLTLCGLLACQAYAWEYPVTVTTDTCLSLVPSCAIDDEGNLHFFFANNRYAEGSSYLEVFHSKYSLEGVRLTEDVRISHSYSYYPEPDAIFGSDQKLHVIWDDNSWMEPSPKGIYYSRLDIEGNIEREATLVFPCLAVDPVPLFQSSDGNLNVVWVGDHDTLYYGKFDTSGQVIIPQTVVHTTGSAGNIYYMYACIDTQDRIHSIWRRGYGGPGEFNIGYSRISCEGEVLIDYAPLTPQDPDTGCIGGAVVTDENNDVHIIYLKTLFDGQHQFYRKVDNDLNTIYDIMLVEPVMSGSEIGFGDMSLDSYGNVVMAFAYNHSGIEENYKRATYSIEGEELIAPEYIVSDGPLENISYPDLNATVGGTVVFTYWAGVDWCSSGKVHYTYTIDELAVNNSNCPPYPVSLNLSIFPNPSNATTTISFALPEAVHVKLTIFNINGQVVETLIDGYREAANHQVTFDASHLASGLYFYRIEAGSYSDVKKMVLVK